MENIEERFSMDTCQLIGISCGGNIFCFHAAKPWNLGVTCICCKCFLKHAPSFCQGLRDQVKSKFIEMPPTSSHATKVFVQLCSIMVRITRWICAEKAKIFATTWRFFLGVLVFLYSTLTYIYTMYQFWETKAGKDKWSTVNAQAAKSRLFFFLQS